MLNRIRSAYVPIEQMRQLKLKYQLLLFEPRLLFRYKKDWIAYLIASIMYNLYTFGRISNDEAKKYIQQIRLYDSELADRIENVLPTAGGDFGIFSELLGELKKGRQYFVSYIATHSTELIGKAKSMKDKDPKLSKQLVDLFTAISGHEIGYLMKYRGDCEDWTHYAVRYNIDFFVNRINFFLNGVLDNSSRAQFQGLYKDFGDEKIQRIILRNNAVRNLGSYLNQVKYLNLLIGMCRRAYVSGDWNKGFFSPKGFWTDFDKYAGDFARVYGNVDFKERLIAIERKKEYELPQFWGGVWERSEIQDINALRQRGILYTIEGGVIYVIKQEQDGVLTKLLSELYSRRYQINNVIHPAAAALMKIFEERENELRASINQAVRDLVKLLIGMSGIPKIRKFRKLLRKKKHHLFNNLNIAQTEFGYTATAPLQQYEDYINAVNQTLAKISPEFIEGNRIRLLRNAISNLAYLGTNLPSDKFARDKITYMRMIYADKAAEEADIRDVTLVRLEHLDDADLEKIEGLIRKGLSLVTSLRTVDAFIKSRLEKDFALYNIPAIDFSAIANRTFDLDYIKSGFDNELKKAIIEFQQRQKVR